MATIKKISGLDDAGTLTTAHRLLVESPEGTLMSTTVGDLPTGSGGFPDTPPIGNAKIVSVDGLGDAAYRGVDSSPTSGSTNLVTSGGVYNLIGIVGDINAILDRINGEVV